MTSAPFLGGAIDLSTLKPTPPPPAGATWVVDADDQSFESYLALSVQHPLVVEFWSPRAQGAEGLSADLKALADEAAGSYLLVRVNVDEARGIAQALQVQSIPAVFAVIGGQLVPGFQGALPEAQIREFVEAVLKAGEEAGLTGTTGQPAAPGEPIDMAKEASAFPPPAAPVVPPPAPKPAESNDAAPAEESQ